MNTITAIIVDDEDHNREVLRSLLYLHCQNIQIVGEAMNVDEAFTIINLKKPQMVFLDVMMPEKSGFDLLKMFDQTINFEVIFVSAFNEHAVTAFDYNALGYILKPIDYNKLITAVNKAILKIGINSQNNSVLQFIKTLEPDTDSIAKIAVHHNEKVVLLKVSDVIAIWANESICHIELLNNECYYSSKDLKLFDGMLRDNGNFARINKNAVVNLDHIKSYVKGDVCILQMSNNSKFEVSRRKKTEILQRIHLIW